MYITHQNNLYKEIKFGVIMGEKLKIKRITKRPNKKFLDDSKELEEVGL